MVSIKPYIVSNVHIYLRCTIDSVRGLLSSKHTSIKVALLRFLLCFNLQLALSLGILEQHVLIAICGVEKQIVARFFLRKVRQAD